MTPDEFAALTITRPVRMKDCVICGDTLPPSDDAIVAAGTACLCARHEASLRHLISQPPDPHWRENLVHRVFGSIV